MKLAFTGHRSDKLFGTWNIPNPKWSELSWNLKNLLEELKPEICMSGAAQGYDLMAANVCTHLGIPWIAAVPCDNQEKIWPKEAQERYHRLLSKAKEIIIVSPGPYSASKMFTRNHFMVDWLDQPEDRLLACWDGSKGGTFECISYAKKNNKEIIYQSLI